MSGSASQSALSGATAPEWSAPARSGNQADACRSSEHVTPFSAAPGSDEPAPGPTPPTREPVDPAGTSAPISPRSRPGPGGLGLQPAREPAHRSAPCHIEPAECRPLSECTEPESHPSARFDDEPDFEPEIQSTPEPFAPGSRSPSHCDQRTGSPWDSIPVPTGYTLDETGVQVQKDGPRITRGPIWVKAAHVETYSGEHGLVIEWRDAFGAAQEIAVGRGELHAYGSPLAARLARAGLVVVHGAERHLLKYLSEFDVANLPRWQAVSRVGWIESDDGKLAYMLPPPQGLLAHDTHRPVIFQPEGESPSSSSVYPRGTLKDWNEHVLSSCKDNPLLLFPVLVGLSGPLLRFAKQESGGFHYYGRSSHGKTTAAQAAASVWGNGADPAEAPDRALIQKWNATANAFEALLCSHNDGLLVLDEIHTCGAKDFGAVIYNIAGGKGKQALTRERQLRASRKWRTMYFSTGEVSVLSKLEADGSTAHAGQLIRLIDIPIESGIITKWGPEGPAHYADRLKSACSRFFGTAGPALIRALEAEYESVGQLVGTIKTKAEGHATRLTPKDAAPEARRAIKRFALAMTAGEMAIKLGVLNCEMQQVETAVRTALRAWLTDSARIPDRLRGVMNVADFIHRHAARFQSLSDGAGAPIPRDRVGYRDQDRAAGSEVYMFTSEGFREACGGLDPRETAEELKRLRILVARERGRHTEKREAGTDRGRFYIVKATLLEFDPLSASTLDDG